MYKDRWLGSSLPMATTQLRVKDLFLDSNYPNSDFITAYLGNDVYNEIKKKNIRLTLKQDNPVWTGTHSGESSIHSA